MPIEKIKKNIIIKILILVIIGVFLINSIIYLWILDYYNSWYEYTAQVVEINKIKNKGTSKSGYSFIIKLKIKSNLPKFNNLVDTVENFGLNTNERSIFFENTSANKIIPVWINPFYNYEIEITKPIKPNFTKYLPLIFFVFGFIFFAIGAFLFGERIKK